MFCASCLASAKNKIKIIIAFLSAILLGTFQVSKISSHLCYFVGCKKVGTIGFCMGGALALASAAQIPEEISAAAPFYGIPKPDLCDLGKIKIPVQAHFGSKDTIEGFSSPKDAKAMAEKFDAGGVTYELFMYDAGHSFANPTSANYTKEICDLAIERVIDFMKKHLR